MVALVIVFRRVPGGDTHLERTRPGVVAVPTGRDAFAAIDDLQDSLEDAIPTLFDCSDVAEWISTCKGTPGHSLIVARGTAKNLCRSQEDVENAPVCESL